MGDKEKWMQLSRTEGAFAVSLLALALVGCQSDRFGSLPTRSPQPLQPAPAGSVMQSQLPPPSQPSGPNDFPAAPGQENGRQMAAIRSEEHTSELQSRENLVCRLLLEK